MMAAPPPSLAVIGPPARDDDPPQLDTEAEIARLRERLMLRAPARSGWFGDVVNSITKAGADTDWHRRAQIRWLVVEVVLLGGLAVAAVLILVLF